jgi:hypothetical protein
MPIPSFFYKLACCLADGEVQDSKSRRPDSRMTFIADEENGGQKPLIEGNFAVLSREILV